MKTKLRQALLPVMLGASLLFGSPNQAKAQEEDNVKNKKEELGEKVIPYAFNSFDFTGDGYGSNFTSLGVGYQINKNLSIDASIGYLDVNGVKYQDFNKWDQCLWTNGIVQYTNDDKNLTILGGYRYNHSPGAEIKYTPEIGKRSPVTVEGLVQSYKRYGEKPSARTQLKFNVNEITGIANDKVPQVSAGYTAVKRGGEAGVDHEFNANIAYVTDIGNNTAVISFERGNLLPASGMPPTNSVKMVYVFK